MWKKIAAVLLLIIGVLFIFSDQISEKYIDYQVQQVSKEAYAVTPLQIKENDERVLPAELEAERFDFTQVEAINVNATWQTILEQVMETDSQSPYFDEESIPDESYLSPNPGESETKPDSQTGSGTGTETGTPNGTGSETGTPSGTGSETGTPSGTESGTGIPSGTGSPLSPGTKGSTETATKPATQKPATMTDEQAKKELKKYAQKQIIGIIKAPSVGLEVGVLKGVLNRTLMLGAGTMRPDQVMGQGNYSVITHRTRRPGLLFSGVPKIKTGSLVFITDKQTIYTYKVYDRFNVHKSKTEVIYDEVSEKRGKPVLTLVTCFSLKDPAARVIVHAELIDSQPYTAETFTALK